MGRIHVLCAARANKLPAGEWVDRPASVVKELLENALDAGSTRIRIQVEAGGKKLIQITDNGCGMGRDESLVGLRAPRYLENQRHRRPTEHLDARISRRGAALHRLGRTAASGNPRGRGS